MDTASPRQSIFDAARTGHPSAFGRIFPADPAWLARAASEEALEPDLPIIDTHHHLWSMPNDRYQSAEFLQDLDTGHRIVATVYVECNSGWRRVGDQALRPVGETEYVVADTAASRVGTTQNQGIAAAIVGYADLALGAQVRPVLEAHIDAGKGRFRGVRYPTAWDADPSIGNSHQPDIRPGMLRETAVQAGLRCLSDLQLSFDAWLFYTQLQDVCRAADALPDLNIVLGHCGGPLGYGVYQNRQLDVFKQWRASMADIAQRSNVSVKLGGMMMRLAAVNYLTDTQPPRSEQLAECWRPYLETCIELFGAQRCMVESNFPVEKMGCGYCALFNAFKRVTAPISPAEKAALYADTARRVYRL